VERYITASTVHHITAVLSTEILNTGDAGMARKPRLWCKKVAQQVSVNVSGDPHSKTPRRETDFSHQCQNRSVWSGGQGDISAVFRGIVADDRQESVVVSLTLAPVSLNNVRWCRCLLNVRIAVCLHVSRGSIGKLTIPGPRASTLSTPRSVPKWNASDSDVRMLAC